MIGVDADQYAFLMAEGKRIREVHYHLCNERHR